MTKLLITSSVLLLLLIPVAFALDAFPPNKGLLEYDFTSSELVKIHPELQNQIEESPDELLPVLIRSDQQENLTSMIQDIGGTAKLTTRNYVAVELTTHQLKQIINSPVVQNIYPDRVFHATLDRSVYAINVPVFWNASYKGHGMVIAILDTGIDTSHPLLQGKVILEKDFTGENHTNDVRGHGTHVAGIAAGNGLLQGVAPEAKLINAKVLDDTGIGTTSEIVAGMEWVIDPDNNPATDDGADIISMSLGGAYGQPDQAFLDAVAYAHSQGVVVVVASGNCGADCPDPSCGAFRGVTTPGNIKDVLTVGAVDDSNYRACFSSGEYIPNVGIKPDIVAPGVLINSSIPGGYGEQSGTSMATPHVAGATALLLQQHPDYTPQQIKDALSATATDLGALGKDTAYGAGLINLADLFSFDVNSLIEFDVSHLDVIKVGEPFAITVTITDEVVVHEVRAMITYPNQTTVTFFLQGSDGIYTGQFLNTGTEGLYALTITINYESGYEVSSTGFFSVVSTTGFFGKITDITYPPRINKNDNLSINVTFENTNTTALAVAIEAMLVQNETIMASSPYPPVVVNPFSVQTIPVMWRMNYTPGNYTLTIVADYAVGYDDQNGTLLITDVEAPLVYGITYSDSLQNNNPFVLRMNVSDDSPIQGILHVTAPDYTVQITNITEAGIGTFSETNSIGTYTFTYTLCDSFSNCINSSLYSFDIAECTGEHVLMVKDESEMPISGYCVSAWDKLLSGTPSLDYLLRFDAVAWLSGNSITTINDDDAALLVAYIANNGTLLIEGADIAFNHGYDEFSQNVTHAMLDKDIFFTSVNETMPNASLSVVLNHPVLRNLPENVSLNTSLSPYPDGVLPYAGGFSLMEWNDQNASAMVIYEGLLNNTGAKVLFVPFALQALQGDAQPLLQNTLEWLTAGQDHADLIPRLQEVYLIEGNNILPIALENKGSQDVSQAKIEIFVDYELVQTNYVDVDAHETVFISPAVDISVGFHTLSVSVNGDFAFEETVYLNNIDSKEMRVATREADLVLEEVFFSIDDPSQILATIANIGGSDATNVSVDVWVDSVLYATTIIDLDYGERINLSLRGPDTPGVYAISVVANANQSIEESNYSNNHKDAILNVCSKEKIIIVDDNDAESSFTENPSSADTFHHTLQADGYCVSLWNESSQGIPSVDILTSYDLVVWSTGDYWNTVINESDMILLENYTGAMLFEGSDIAFDHQNDSFPAEHLHAFFHNDLVLQQTTDIMLTSERSQEIFGDLLSVTINESLSPYPDAVSATNGWTIAQWNDGHDAIIAYNDSTSPMLYFAFSLDAIVDDGVKNTVVIDAVEWLIQVLNRPPILQKIVDISIEEDQRHTFFINATDPDDDDLTYLVSSENRYTVNCSVEENRVTLIPLPNWFGTSSCGIEVRDNQGGSVTDIFMVTVLPVNDAPVVYAIAPIQVTEGSIIDQPIYAFDIERDVLNYAVNDSRFTLNGSHLTFKTQEGDEANFTVQIAVDDTVNTTTQIIPITIQPFTGVIDTFYDGSGNKILTYPSPGYQDVYIRVKKDSLIINSSLIIQGYD